MRELRAVVTPDDRTDRPDRTDVTCDWLPRPHIRNNRNARTISHLPAGLCRACFGQEITRHWLELPKFID